MMRIVYNSVLPLGSYKAMAVGPWIFVKWGTELTAQDIQHEEIHWCQQKELLIVGFYLLYVLLFVWELLRCTFQPRRGQLPDGTPQWRKRSLWKRAYRSVAFEREAYQNEAVQFYIRHRRHYAWLRKDCQ